MNSPLVSIVITHHFSKNRDYLNLCARSFLLSVGIDLEILVVADSEENPYEYLPKDERLKVIWDKSLTNQAIKIDHGIEMMHPESKFIFLSNDDIMINKYSLGLMMEWAFNTSCVINGLCNSDNKAIWLGSMALKTPAGDIDLKNSMTIEELKGQDEFIMNLPPIPGPRNLWFQDWVPLYATCIPKFLWEKVGSLDPKLDTYGNDYDWCMRAKDLKYRCAVDPNAFILHFHHKSLAHTKTDKGIEDSKKYLVEKRKLAMGIS